VSCSVQISSATLGLLPAWLGDERVHASHRAALVGKDAAHYASRFGNIDPDLPYFWPVRAADRRRSEAPDAALTDAGVRHRMRPNG